MLTGEINGADLDYIATRMRSLDLLDLSGVRIVGYEGPRIAAGLRRHGPDMLPPFQLAGLSAGRLILPSGITAIGECALTGSSITEIDIPSSVRTIGMGAFAGCTALGRVTVPSSIKEVGSHVFDGCTSLSEVVFLPSPVPPSAFAGCRSLVSVTLSATCDTIGDSAFKGCTSLAGFDFPASLVSVGDEAFASTGLLAARLGGSVCLRSVGSRAFAQCPSLTEVRFPAGLVRLGEGICLCDSSLVSVNIPSSVQAVPRLSFAGARHVVSLDDVLVEGIDSVALFSFSGLGDVRAVTLPSSLSHIGDNAFERMIGLREIEGGALTGVPVLGDSVWAGVDVRSVALYVDERFTDDFLCAPQWKEFDILVSGIEDVSATPSVSLRVRFDGTLLVAELPGPFVSASLFGLDGSLLDIRDGGDGACVLSFDTSPFKENFFILSVSLRSGLRPAIKLLRN